MDKNIKDDEMRAIITMQAQRLQQGKSSSFYVRGREVDPQKIKRFARRKELKMDDDTARNASSKDALKNLRSDF